MYQGEKERRYIYIEREIRKREREGDQGERDQGER